MKRDYRSAAQAARDALIRDLARDLDEPLRYDLVEYAKGASLFREIFIRSVHEDVPWIWRDYLETKRNTPLSALLKTLVDHYSTLGAMALRIADELLERKREIEKEQKKVEKHRRDLQRATKRN